MREQYFVNQPYREYIRRIIKLDKADLDELVEMSWQGVHEKLSAEGSLDYVIQSLTHKEGAFASKHFWEQAICGEATVYVVSTLRLLLDGKVSSNLLDCADAATDSPADGSRIAAFYERLTEASTHDQELTGDIFMLASHVFAWLAYEDKATRRNMGIKVGLFS